MEIRKRIIMKHYFYLIFIVSLLACNNSVSEDISFARVDPFLKIYKESNYFPDFSDTMEVASGEHASFQFAIRSSKPIQDLSISVEAFKQTDGSSLGELTKGFVEFVRVGRKTPDRDKSAIPPLSQYYPDPIMELPSYQVERDVAQPMWVTVAIPEQTKAGNYKSTFKVSGKISGKAFGFEREMLVKVYPVVMEKPSLWVTNWFFMSPDKMQILNEGKEVETYSDRYWELAKELVVKMKECYQNTFLISPLEHTVFTENNGSYSFDFTNFGKVIQLFKDVGILKMIEGGHIAERTGDWGSGFAPNVPVMINGKQELKQYPMSSPEAQNFYMQFVPALMAYLKENKWDQIYVQHIADEPILSNIKSYVEIADFVKQAAPGIRLIEACHSHDLENVLDIWVPQLNYYKDGYDFYTERQKQGDEVWFYTCLAPQGDYANRFLEQPLIKTRLIHWINYRYGATGYLHWGFNYWQNNNPYKETTFSNIESGNVLPGGDSWIVYPYNGKLFGSLRLEAMRDGIADYTLLKMLEKKDPDLAKELCRQVCFHWTLYDTEGDHFRKIRQKILVNLSK